ncbi:MAG: 4'-phosphopantetheinyl transferase superfamily protein [bacterium]|nr:4'-phosphopantetheinyl transferase superfamily protein [bacterium]
MTGSSEKFKQRSYAKDTMRERQTPREPQTRTPAPALSFRATALKTGANAGEAQALSTNDDVHLWYARIDRVDATAFERLAATLADDELKRAGEYMQEKDRRTSIIARGLLRTRLSAYTGVPARELRFATIGNGKPVLAPGSAGLRQARTPLHFNISHSGEGILLGFTRLAEIGVDIEAADRNIDDLFGIAENFFAAGETAALKGLDPERQRPGFLNCWTRKEAFIKVHGEGLSRDLNSFEVELHPDAPPRLLRLDGSEAAARRYMLQAVDPEPAYVAAICLPAKPRQVHAFAWDGSFQS